MSKPKRKASPRKPKLPIPPRHTLLQQWFDQHCHLLFISVLALAGLLRLGLLLELPSLPFSQLHKGTELDMNFFDLWGDRIAEGDMLTDTVWHPYHSWHAELAKSIGLQNEIAGKQKWAEWYGGKKYHQEPLYPLLIGLAKMISSKGLLLIYILQMLLGLISIWIIMWLGMHYFGAMAGVLGGLIFTLYSPNLLFDAVLLRTSFNTLLLLGIIFLAEKLMMGRSKPWLMGVLGGTGYILMTTSMMLWIPLVIRWLYVRREDLKKTWQVAMGFCLVVSLLVFRNLHTGSPPLSTSSVGTITYVLSNFPGFEPERGFAYYPPAGEIMESTGGKMIPAALKVISMHKSIWKWVVLQFRKLGAVFHWYEIPNNINSYLAQASSIPLKIAFIPYSIIAALGILGMLLSLKNSKTYNLQFGILTQIAILVIFYVLCRFRVPMVAMLAVFSGYTVQQMTHLHYPKRVILLAIAVAGLWAFVLRPYPKIPALFQQGDLAMNFHTYYKPELDRLLAKGDMESSIELFKDLIGTMPGSIKHIDPGKKLSSTREQDLAHYYSLLYFDLGNLYKEAGNEKMANESYEENKKLKFLSGRQ